MFGDMLGVAFKAMGVDPVLMMGMAENLGRSFELIAKSCERQELALERIEASQLAIMTELGLAVPPPTDEQAELIARESLRHADQFGGLLG